MLGGLERHADAGHRPHLAAPHARGVDHDVGADRAVVREDAGHPPGGLRDPGHADALDDPRPAHPGAAGVGLRQVRGVHAALVGHVERGQEQRDVKYPNRK